MKNNRLREEYDQLLSDMLLMQYRVEVFRRKMQVAESSIAIGSRLQTSVEDVVNELVKISNHEQLEHKPVVGLSWWWK
jgi:hypothetical protein